MAESRKINLIEVYDTIVSLSGNTEAINLYIDEIWEQFFTSCCDSETKARQFKWRIDGELRNIKNPVERYNRSVSLMWNSIKLLSENLNGIIET